MTVCCNNNDKYNKHVSQQVRPSTISIRSFTRKVASAHPNFEFIFRFMTCIQVL